MFSLLLTIIYISFISLGLPDSLLGSAWPIMYQELNVPLSWSGIIFFICSVGTVISSLASDYLTKKFRAGRVTAISVMMTAVAMIGYSYCKSFLGLCLWSIPYGLGAGSVDAALNNYVALHFESRHMSWLHCMWGVGASIGPYIMSYALLNTGRWNFGYSSIGYMQLGLSIIIMCSVPLWLKKEKEDRNEGEVEETEPMPLSKVVSIPGAKEIMIAFFCYCAMEQTVCLWASSYLVFNRGMQEVVATSFASLFYLGITAGRAINGFLTYKFSDKQLIYMGETIIAAGIGLLLIPEVEIFALVGFALIGIGCAPIYPCIIHSTPEHFGKENSQAMVGVQMASAYVGISLMPPLFGFLSKALNISILPIYLLIILIIEHLMYKKVISIKR